MNDRPGTLVRLRSASISPVVPALALALLLILLNPVGYVGGDLDDWYYLDAARCITRDGICVPATHWAARQTTVLPTAAVIALFGESRELLWIPPLVFAIAGTVAFTALVQRHFGRTAAGMAAFILVCTPVVGSRFLMLNTDIVEFGAAMLALLALDTGFARKDWRWLAASGALLGIAILARSTSAVLVVMIAAGLVLSARARLVIPFFCGVIGILALDATFYTLTTGNPFHGWSLSLGHIEISRSALAPGVDLTKSPLFNPDFIAGWRQTLGIYLHWTVDGAINTLLDPMIGLALVSALVLMAIGRGGVDRRHWLILAAASCYFGALVYGLAVHPQARMFLPVIAAAAAISGSLTAHLWSRGERPLVAGLLGGMALLAVALNARAMDLREVEPVAVQWAAQRNGQMMIDERTRRTFALAPSLDRLPVPIAAERRFALVLAMNVCPQRLEGDDDAQWAVSRSQLFERPFKGDEYRLCELVRVSASPAASLRRATS